MKTILTMMLLSAAAALSQSVTITGLVEDQSRGRIPGARVALKTIPAGSESATSTDSTGTFRLTGIAVGKAELQVQMPGFTTVIRPLEVSIAGLSDVVVTLTAGTVVQELQVAAAAELLQTDRSAQVSTLTTQQIQSLPTASRNYTHLIVAEAGVAAPLPDRTGRGISLATAPGSEGDDATQSLNPSVNGARPTNNSLMINGVDATNMMNGTGSLGSNINVPLDALEAVEMQTALYSASTGRNGGVNVQMITRSGTNEYHGSVAHFFQNEIFNANEFFLNRGGRERPKFRRNETYAGAGGPIVKNKTFFFAAVQRTDFQTGFADRAIASTAI
ncbi:MAG TPA: carboxypeptidase regulatory-like domain-containing protein, partial [Bryobacteraceae bacterium]|nr:carboxypeptidase regulatory-like domain-containing protein [Bryobacteraceae bacterium]